MLGPLKKGEDIPDLTTINDIFCELVLEHGGNSGDDVALRGYLRDFARSKLRRVLHFVVDDAQEPWTPYSRCPAGADCNTLQGVVLAALVRRDLSIFRSRW